MVRCLIGRKFGLDSTKQLVFHVLYGLYHDFKVDFVGVLWNQFTKTINHPKRATKTSSHTFWSLIVGVVCEQKNIAMPTEEEYLTFTQMQIPKVALN